MSNWLDWRINITSNLIRWLPVTVDNVQGFPSQVKASSAQRPKGTDLRSVDEGLRGFKSHPLHLIAFMT